MKNERTCVYCGCMDSRACAGGCSWMVKHPALFTGVCSGASCIKKFGKDFRGLSQHFHQGEPEDQSNDFTRGFVCATATIISAHGECQVAKDVLRCAGTVPFVMAKADAYDIEILQKVGLLPVRSEVRALPAVLEAGAPARSKMRMKFQRRRQRK